VHASPGAQERYQVPWVKVTSLKVLFQAEELVRATEVTMRHRQAGIGARKRQSELVRQVRHGAKVVVELDYPPHVARAYPGAQARHFEDLSLPPQDSVDEVQHRAVVAAEEPLKALLRAGDPAGGTAGRAERAGSTAGFKAEVVRVAAVADDSRREEPAGRVVADEHGGDRAV
jgi:hypothetical protein